MLLGESAVGVDTIWRVDMQTQATERLVIPRRAHFPSYDHAFTATLSPDGQIAAVSFDQFTANFPWLTENIHWTGSHIVIVQVRLCRYPRSLRAAELGTSQLLLWTTATGKSSSSLFRAAAGNDMNSGSNLVAFVAGD